MDPFVIYDQKWQKLLRRVWLFKYIPFIDFVLVSGSLALGNVHKNSDFDVLVATRKNRLYTARFFCLLLFGAFGWRKSIIKRRAGFCFNYFITEPAYCLEPPYSDYDKRLYESFVPIFGRKEKIRQFLNDNNWLENSGAEDIFFDKRFVERKTIFPKKAEKILFKKAGNAFEFFAKKIQYIKIKNSIKKFASQNSKICYTNDKVKLWFNPRACSFN